MTEGLFFICFKIYVFNFSNTNTAENCSLRGEPLPTPIANGFLENSSPTDIMSQDVSTAYLISVASPVIIE